MFCMSIQNGRPSMQRDYNSMSSLVHKFIDVGLLAANVTQLRVLLSNERSQFYQVNLVLVVLSIIFQVAFLFCVVGVWYVEYKLDEYTTEGQRGVDNTDGQNRPHNNGHNPVNRNENVRKINIMKKRLLRLNITLYILVSLVVLLNVGVCGLGLDGSANDPPEKYGETKYIGVVNGTLKVLN